LDKKRVPTITIPENKSTQVSAGNLPCIVAILAVNGLSDNDAILNAFRPAIGAPMKLTRSLAANAIASANVPIKTINFRTLNLVNFCIIKRMTVQEAYR
jgi:hypothetical protein